MGLPNGKGMKWCDNCNEWRPFHFLTALIKFNWDGRNKTTISIQNRGPNRERNQLNSTQINSNQIKSNQIEWNQTDALNEPTEISTKLDGYLLLITWAAIGCIVAFELPFDSQTRKPIDVAGATKHKPNRTKPNGSNQEDPKIKPKQQQKQKNKS